MRVLFTVSSWPTHYAAMVPLAWALQAAGHEVTALCSPSQVAPLSATGIVPVPVLDDWEVNVRLRLQYYEEAVNGHWPYPWLPLHPVTGAPLKSLDDFDRTEFELRHAPVYAERTAKGFDAGVAFARAWQPDLVLHDPASFEGILIAELLGRPAVLCLWGPVGTHEPAHMSIVPQDHSKSFPRYGLKPFTPDMIRTVIDPCPAAIAPPTPADRLPMQYVPYNGCAPMPGWLLKPPDRPRVCIAWSTALTATAGARSYLLPELVRATNDLDVDVVLTATAEDVAALGPVPASVRVVERLPLRLLLPSCAAVVHHGGSGSTLTSLWAGVPQLLPTFASEQTVTASRVAANGAAVHMLGHEANAASVRAALERLLSDDSYRAAAGRLRTQMRSQPTPADLVATLEKL
ncbi:nucleotide disphospho-sugar-binding domain-containing protein [Micromonospora profundi]|uniref:nucleotide disphospho-sugar-binding domain-containing protein n=1 Tax=Micromonospora profundi TaxID=1420889 RepID=UPI0036CED93E